MLVGTLGTQDRQSLTGLAFLAVPVCFQELLSQTTTKPGGVKVAGIYPLF